MLWWFPLGGWLLLILVVLGGLLLRGIVTMGGRTGGMVLVGGQIQNGFWPSVSLAGRSTKRTI